MAIYPWRFQCDLQEGDTNPDVTVFIGDTTTNDTTGEKTLHKGTNDPEIVKLSDLSNYIATGLASGVTRTKKPVVAEVKESK